MISPQAATSATRSTTSLAVLIISTVVALVIDLASKTWVFQSLLPDKTQITLIPGWLNFRLVHNKGALFGMGAGMRTLFIASSFVAAAFVIYLFATSSSRQRWFHLGLGLILGGAGGNLYDRLIHGEVRDFIHFAKKIGSLELWPWIFNFADVFLVIGVAVVLLQWWQTPHPTHPKPDSAEKSSLADRRNS